MVKKAKKKAATAVQSVDTSSTATADLESIVFGRGAEFVEEDPVSEAEAEEDGEGSDDEDRKGSSLVATPMRKRKKGAARARRAAAPTAAWADADDAELEVDLNARSKTRKLRHTDAETKVSGVEYEERLRNQHHRLHGATGWAERKPTAQAAGADSDDDEEEIATSAKLCAAVGSGAASGGPLRPTEVDIARLRDVDVAPGGGKGVVMQTLQFHPNSELLLQGGLDKRLRLFAIDGNENPKVSSFFIKGFPIKEASFTPEGDQVLVVGTSYKMWALDVRTGDWLDIRDGLSVQTHSRLFGLTVGPNPADQPGLKSSQMYAVLGDSGSLISYDIQSKLPIRTFRMSAPGAAAAFSPDRDTLWSADTEGGLYEWDLRTGRCRQRARDPWATKISCLALGRTTAYAPTPMMAVGTESGNVDFFDLGGPSFPKEPTKTMNNLTTRITSLKFHHEGEILVAATKWKVDSLKLLHMGTGTVYQNWPTNKTPLHNVSALDFSRKGGMLAIGNEKGRVLLYRMNHYERTG